MSRIFQGEAFDQPSHPVHAFRWQERRTRSAHPGPDPARVEDENPYSLGFELVGEALHSGIERCFALSVIVVARTLYIGDAAHVGADSDNQAFFAPG